MTDGEITRFLYREARLMDEHRYREWLALWTDDAIYWVPCSDAAVDPDREVSIIYDDRARLEDRAGYLEGGTVLEAGSKPRMRRMISNIEITPINDTETEVSSNFLMAEIRGPSQYLWSGRSIHRLRRHGDELKICFKKVLLVNNEQPLSVVQFLF